MEYKFFETIVSGFYEKGPRRHEVGQTTKCNLALEVSKLFFLSLQAQGEMSTKKKRTQLCIINKGGYFIYTFNVKPGVHDFSKFAVRSDRTAAAFLFLYLLFLGYICVKT